MLLSVVSQAAQVMQHRSECLKRWLARAWVFSRYCMGVALCVGLVWGSYRVYGLICKADYFRLKTIQIAGNRDLTRDDALYLLAIPREITLLQLDLPSIAARLGRHPYVKSVAIRRRFPATLSVTMQERSPHLVVVSKWQRMVLDAEGVVLRPFMPQRDRELPQFSLRRKRALMPGMRLKQKDIQRAMALVQAYQESSVVKMMHLVALSVEPSGASIWQVEPYDFDIRIGAGDVSGQLKRLVSVLPYIMQQNLAVRRIDVSYRKRVIVKLIAS
ncbi:MAG: FtsQ-type POTRA domain-containing protein [bacterium]|nr:FtsQ-type POTRA domain-containing protein [bacterium]